MGRLKNRAQKRYKTRYNLGGRVAQTAISAITGGKRGSSGKRRNRGPAYWANKVLVEKLKKRYHKIKYGGAR